MAKRSVYDKTLDLLAQNSTEVLRAIIEGSFWPQGVDLNKSYSLPGDDKGGQLSVSIAQNGDVRIFSRAEPQESGVLFRSGFSAGIHPRIRNAFITVAYAMKLSEAEPHSD